MKKLLLAILAAACAVTCALGLAACGDDSGNGHVHSWEAEWSTDGTSHWHECKDPTCNETLLLAEHDWELTATAKTATCYASGSGTYTCRKCKTTKTDEIPATGNHVFGGSLLSSEEGHYHTCTNTGCTATSAPEKHIEPLLPTKTYKPSELGTATGLAEYNCTECNYLIRTEDLPSESTVTTFKLNVTKVSSASSAMTPVMTERAGEKNAYDLTVTTDSGSPLYNYSYTGYNAYGSALTGRNGVSTSDVTAYLYNEVTEKETEVDWSGVEVVIFNGNFRIKRAGSYVLKFKYKEGTSSEIVITVYVTAV